MTEKLWIFGDSYSDKEYTYDHSFSSWPYEIEKLYKVTNFSKIGSGPDYSIDILLQEINNYTEAELKNITIIFFVSSVYRFKFDFLSIKDQALSDKFLHHGNLKDFKHYKKYKSFVEDFFKFYIFNRDYEKVELYKIFGLLSLLSKKFKKVLVWPIFQMSDINCTPTNNFLVVEAPLYRLTKLTIKIYPDTRNNHLSKDNHEVMLTELVNWIEKDWPVNTNNFH